MKIIRKLLNKKRNPLKPYFIACGYEFNNSKSFNYYTLEELKNYIENDGTGSLHVFRSTDELDIETIFVDELKDSDIK